MDNMELYNKFRQPPQEALKKISGGALGSAGFLNINPQWRLKALTEMFGPCGKGWYYTIDKMWIESPTVWNDNQGTAMYTDMTANVEVSLYVKFPGDTEWSAPIKGLGGSKLVASGRVSDECYKMAKTDAIGVACQQLGIGADIYWETDPTKYDAVKCSCCGKEITSVVGKDGNVIPARDVVLTSQKRFGIPMCADCTKKKTNENKDK